MCRSAPSAPIALAYRRIGAGRRWIRSFPYEKRAKTRVCHFFTHGKNFLINQRSFTMWEALRTILSTLSVQKSTGLNWRRGTSTLRFFCAWKKYPYESTTLTTRRPIANNLIHIFCAELPSSPLLVAEVGRSDRMPYFYSRK
jgi:hypothetical protein